MAKKADPDYIQNLRLTKSLLIVTSLQKRRDIEAKLLVEKLPVPLEFHPLQELLIEEKAWQHVLAELAETDNCNPPEQPVVPVGMQSVKLTWLEGLLHKGSGKGFTFYPHDAHEAV